MFTLLDIIKIMTIERMSQKRDKIKNPYLPNMVTSSSGSVSFSSLVSTCRKKRTVGLSNSPNSITYKGIVRVKEHLLTNLLH